MKAVRTILVIALAIVVLFVKLKTDGPGGGAAPAVHSPNGASVAGVPDKALHVLQIVRETGQPPDGYVGGRVFENREGRLPPGGDYREFDVDPYNGPRNAERIIVDWNTRQAWYTGDHYRTFIPMP
jgi:ribonuclease T1